MALISILHKLSASYLLTELKLYSCSQQCM